MDKDKSSFNIDPILRTMMSSVTEKNGAYYKALMI